jgi:hypothetical protein
LFTEKASFLADEGAERSNNTKQIKNSPSLPLSFKMYLKTHHPTVDTGLITSLTTFFVRDSNQISFYDSAQLLGSQNLFNTNIFIDSSVPEYKTCYFHIKKLKKKLKTKKHNNLVIMLEMITKIPQPPSN